MPGTAKKQIESTSSTQFAAANPNLITEHINPLYNYSPAAEQEEDILEMPSPWAGIRENADKRVADARERREAADQEQDIEINRIEHSNQLKEFNKKESQKIKKDAERKRVNKKIEKHRGPSRFSSKIGRFRDGIKHAVKGAQSQKSAGFVAGNLVIADAAALTYYDDIAAKEINDGIVYPSQMNRQPSTLEIFKKSNLSNWLDNVMYYFGNVLFYGSILYLAISIYGSFVKSASISISDVEESDVEESGNTLINESFVKEVIAFVLIGIFGLLIVSHFG
jgi:hypothetical protein